MRTGQNQIRANKIFLEYWPYFFSVTLHVGKLLNFGRFLGIEEESVSFCFQHSLAYAEDCDPLKVVKSPMLWDNVGSFLQFLHNMPDHEEYFLPRVKDF